MAADQPHATPITAAGEALERRHHVRDYAPKRIPAWSGLRTLPLWLRRLKTACLTAEPNAAKAAEWILDNHFHIERAIRQIREDMPSAFYSRLPSLENADSEGLPRIFLVAHGLLNTSHLQLSLSAAVEFVNAYQAKSPLTIAELWAFPTMLRLASLEILVKAASTLFPDLNAPFEDRAGAEELVFIDPTENVARAIGSLQVISSIPWKDFFDSASLVEKTLQADPAEVYSRMDFDTRDRYRKAIEDVAAGAGVSELETAKQVVAQAQGSAGDKPRDHVGYWLIGDGRKEIERLTKSRLPFDAALGRWVVDHSGPIYGASLAAVCLAALCLPIIYLVIQNASPLILAAGVALTLIPATIVSMTVVNWIFTLSTPPRLLPKLDFEKGIPKDCATAVVMPVIVGSEAEARALVDRLEMHRLMNPDPSLRFVLLSDHTDAATETTPQDRAIEQTLINAIRRLNAEHGADGHAPFHLLHRLREHNPQERRWMAWERKRGKLQQFNAFVLSGDKSAFAIEEGDSERLRGIRFVVTVDADTVLPMGSVNRLAGVLGHPMNQADFDPESGRVRAGYTVIQPRIEITPEGQPRSLFLRFFTGDTAIDIYSRAVSNIYQDLFGSAVYIGKGVYEVAAFERSLENRVPENALLSHDLFEGAHGRTALATDIVCYDGFPSAYLEYVRRWHRWVRGDWQLLPWLAGRVPGADGEKQINRLSLLDRWKIFDNLRRSLVPPALVALAAAGWFFLPGSAWVWTLLTILAPGAHLVTELATGLSHARRRAAFQNALHQFTEQAGRWALAVVFLLYEAAVAADAIGRTLWRVLVSRQKLLEWTSAAHTSAELKRKHPRRHAWKEMIAAPILSSAIALGLALVNPSALPAASGLLLLWFLSPEIALWISRFTEPSREALTANQHAFLRQVARRTWYFFETFVGPEDNWLPPDNFQEDPEPTIAHRTSPTNIGLMFLSLLAARDFGYLSPADFALRIQNSLDTLDKLDRYRGHFLNWYDTRLLSPLEPRYVSAVDSGNLAVCLITLKEGCLEAANEPALRVNRWDGLVDAFDLLADALKRAMKSESNSALSSQLSAMRDRLTAAPKDPVRWRAHVASLINRVWPELEEAIAHEIQATHSPSFVSMREINARMERVNHGLARLQWDFDNLFPWFALMDTAPPLCRAFADEISELLTPAMTLADAADRCARASALTSEQLSSEAMDKDSAQWLADLAAAIESGAQTQRQLQERLVNNAARASDMAYEMDFRLVYDPEVRLFHIGYNVSSDRMDSNHYDFLATEARLASYFAIGKGDVPPEHWRFLGRPVTRVDGALSLLSWDGSMFEYLMPALLLKNGEGTLLDRSEKSAVAVQRRYAETLDIPWGISESGFSSRDAAGNYQYRAFGVPGLGLRRGLSEDIVIAPYASALALAVCPAAAALNMARLAQLDMLNLYGFFEAADFTQERTSGRQFTPVRSFMSHHQGMLLAAIANALHDDSMPKRFLSNKRMQTASLLLQERAPWELPPESAQEDETAETTTRAVALPALYPWAPPADAAAAQLHLLGNGRLATWISSAGGGALWWRGHSLTRWRSDMTRDNLGLWVYVRDTESDAVWSAGQQPTGVVSHDSHVMFHPHMAEFRRRDAGIAMRMEVGVASRDDLEIRLITVTNETDRQRSLEITSCAEVALAPPLDDERHPAFNKMFIESEYLSHIAGLMFTRRPHQPLEQPPALLHRVVCDDKGPDSIRFEADRSAFFDRNGGARRPRGVVDDLSGQSGWTLDPIMALQAHITLAPHERRQLAFVTIAAGSQETALEVSERHATIASLEWALSDAGREAAHEAQQLSIKPEQLPTFQALTSLIAHPHPSLRAGSADRKANSLGQPRLWSLGVSGDNPIVLVRVGVSTSREFLLRLVRMHDLWRRRLFKVDMIILRTGVSGYVEPARERLLSVLRETGAHEMLGRNGGVHLVFADQIPPDHRRLLECSASIVLDDRLGSLMQQLAVARRHPSPPRFEPPGPVSPPPTIEPAAPPPLEFHNGVGGFSEDGKEYVIRLAPGERTPAPWCNVLANDQFGCLTSESGSGFTWAVNSGENRLTPWANDPVRDPPGEVLYLRDEESAEIWTPTPTPAGADVAYEIRHGAGYTTWLNRSHGLEQELTVFVAADDPIKIARLRLHNPHERMRRVTATYYAEWQLGPVRSTHSPHVVCEYDAEDRALFARNPWNPEFSERVALLASDRPPHSLTTDRCDFLGRMGDLERPEGLLRWDLGGRIVAGGDPCAAYQAHLDIGPGETHETIFILGQGRNRDDAKQLIEKWREPDKAQQALADVRALWDQRLTAVQVKTPDPAFDMMMNRWMLYQTISSRIMSRAGYYQAGGAIGYRDQLQDMMSLFIADPGRARSHILDCASRQFEEGDVLHWWHPPLGRGVRTRCSDDLLWLPYVVARYVKETGDWSILDEPAPFLKAPQLGPDEGDRYSLFETSAETASLFEHCQRALERGVTQGPHGLPLIGASDWNDGMNRVGAKGRGESVWLAWFCIATMTGFADLAAHRNQQGLAEEWRMRAKNLKATIDEVAWDGEWYVRAFDDEGRPWGSKNCDECRIDSIAQSWSVLSGAGATERARTAIRSAAHELVSDEDRLVRLLRPPFQNTPRDPGYIKAYPPGVRENGGQYSHAAAWLGLALAELGDGDGAWRIFDIINPIGRTMTRQAAEFYRDEPYVVAADVGGAAPHVGRGGWSWYTGAAGWTWRLGFEGIVGIHVRGNAVKIDPRLPKAWGSAQVEIKSPSGALSIEIVDPDHLGAGAVEMAVEGVPVDGTTVAFPTDGSVRRVRVTIQRSSQTRDTRPPAVSEA